LGYCSIECSAVIDDKHPVKSQGPGKNAKEVCYGSELEHSGLLNKEVSIIGKLLLMAFDYCMIFPSTQHWTENGCRF
jgi:hypothetical protein